MMLLIRSMSTGELVRSSGSRRSPSPGPRRSRSSGSAEAEPGSHSTNFSPMSDCGRIVHSASAFQGVNSSSSIRRTRAAFSSSVTSSCDTTPTGTPATFTSSPSTMLEALSKIARTK